VKAKIKLNNFTRLFGGSRAVIIAKNFALGVENGASPKGREDLFGSSGQRLRHGAQWVRGDTKRMKKLFALLQ
jgi:hypothetical protein